MRQAVGLRASDCGVVVALDQWLVDSWATRVCCRIEEAPFEYVIAGARLRPYVMVDESPSYFDPLPLVVAREGELVFGALPESATHAQLQINRLQIGASDVRLPFGLDPFDPFDPGSDRSGLGPFLAGEDDDRSLPPEWECRGEWLFRLRIPSGPEGRRAAHPAFERVGPCGVAVPWIDSGDHGTLVAVDLIPSPFVAWGPLWKQVAVREPAAPLPAVRLRAERGGERWETAAHGPYGTLGSRLYLEGPSLTPDAVVVDELHAVRLPFPLEHTFPARSFESRPSFDIPFDALGLDGRLRFTIFDVYGDASCFILMYRIAIESRDVQAAWISAAALVDGWDVEQVCQEDGQQPLRDLGLDEIPGVRAMRFGTIRPERDITLRIDALDLALAAPVRIAL
jgi:hypothetical protein